MLCNGIRPPPITRTGMKLSEKERPFYLAQRYEEAASYGPCVVKIYCTDLSALTTDACCRNLQGITELRIWGGFETLIAVPASKERDLPLSFHKNGFDQPRFPGLCKLPDDIGRAPESGSQQAASRTQPVVHRSDYGQRAEVGVASTEPGTSCPVRADDSLER